MSLSGSSPSISPDLHVHRSHESPSNSCGCQESISLREENTKLKMKIKELKKKLNGKNLCLLQMDMLCKWLLSFHKSNVAYLLIGNQASYYKKVLTAKKQQCIYALNCDIWKQQNIGNNGAIGFVVHKIQGMPFDRAESSLLSLNMYSCV